MSRTLATIIKDSRIPGKWKRVLEAYAATANNDGTNIYKSKTKLGDLAGASPDTIYRQTPDLLACGILTVAKTHVCKVENCNKGATHFTGKWGHYTTAYDLHIDQLQNAETYLSAKHQKVRAAKCRKVGDANCGTTLTLKQTQPAAPKPDSSALPSGKEVSKEVSEKASFASLTTPSAAQTLIERVPYFSTKLKHSIDLNDQDIACQFFFDLLPDGLPTEENIVVCFELLCSYESAYLRAVWFWNRRHKTGKLRCASPLDLAHALASESPRSLAAQYAEHDFAECSKCKKLRKCVECGNFEDGSESKQYAEWANTNQQGESYMHRSCFTRKYYMEVVTEDNPPPVPQPPSQQEEPTCECEASFYGNDDHAELCPVLLAQNKATHAQAITER